MSLSNSAKRISSEFNVGWKMLKFTKGLTTVSKGDLSKSKYIISDTQKTNSLLLKGSPILKFSFNLPNSSSIQKKIIDPSIKINIQLPKASIIEKNVDLPVRQRKEIAEPGKIISKKASHMLTIRRKKMRKHKYKKFIKKHKAELAKKRLRRTMEKEAIFKDSLNATLKEAENFSAEKYVTEILEKTKWVRPKTIVRGQPVPKWVAEEYLKEQQEKENIRKRIEELN